MTEECRCAGRLVKMENKNPIGRPSKGLAETLAEEIANRLAKRLAKGLAKKG